MTTLPAVPVARMVDPAMTAAMAQTACGRCCRCTAASSSTRASSSEARWHPLPQRRADEVAVLVLGQGEMGRAVAQALQAHGLPRAGLAARRGARPPCSASAEIVVNLLPLTPDTRGLLDAGFLAALPRGASIVNLARGAHVNDADLLQALDSGHLAHAVLDVFHVEPLPSDHAYWRHPKVSLLPHAAAQTDPRSAAAVVAANLRALRDGRPLRHLVDRQRGY